MRVRRGAYFDAPEWDSLGSRDRYLVRIRAVAFTRQRPRVISHYSAAAVWGFPIASPWPREVHLTVDRESPARTKNGVTVHRGGVDRSDVYGVDGLLVTSPLRTLLDLARVANFADAVVALDHFLALCDGRSALSGLDSLIDRVDQLEQGRGGQRARRAILFADPRSGSPGESLSRVAIHELGFPPPALQVVHRRAAGGADITDFEWPGYGVIGEFDGQGKYLREEYLGGGSPAEAVYREKVREDRLRRECKSFVRWGWAEAQERHPLRALLLGAGLPLLHKRAGREFPIRSTVTDIADALDRNGNS